MTNKKKVYLVKSQEAYDKLMKELEEKGYLWRSGDKPTGSKYNAFAIRGDSTCVHLDDNKKITTTGTYSDFLKFNKGGFGDYELIEYPVSSDYPGKEWTGKLELPEYTDYPGKQWTGKLELSYVPSQIIRDIAEVRMYGNAKYKASDNWKVVPTKQWIDALYRHLLEFIDNPKGVDSESGIPHYKHMACNLAFICELMREGEDGLLRNGK